MKYGIHEIKIIKEYVQKEFDEIYRPKAEHGSHEQTRIIMLEITYKDTINTLQAAIDKMEILDKHLY